MKYQKPIARDLNDILIASGGCNSGGTVGAAACNGPGSSNDTQCNSNGSTAKGLGCSAVGEWATTSGGCSPGGTASDCNNGGTAA